MIVWQRANTNYFGSLLLKHSRYLSIKLHGIVKAPKYSFSLWAYIRGCNQTEPIAVEISSRMAGGLVS